MNTKQIDQSRRQEAKVEQKAVCALFIPLRAQVNALSCGKVQSTRGIYRFNRKKFTAVSSVGFNGYIGLVGVTA
jgi:hypothetical protein